MIDWHTDTVVVGTAILIVILFEYLPKYSRTEFQDRMFMCCVVGSLIGSILELLTSLTPFIEFLPVGINKLLYFLYYIALCLPGLLWFAYTIAVVETVQRRIKRAVVPIIIVAVIWVIAFIINLFYPFVYYFDDAGVYTRSGLYGVQVGLYSIVALSFIGYVIARRDRFPSRRLMALVIALPSIYFVGIIVQVLLPGWLLMYPAYSIALLLAYFFIQNSRNSEMLGRLSNEAATDKMTGLLNRAGLVERIERRLEEKPDEPYAFLVVDLDSLKGINDVYGHPQGDRAIIELAKAMKGYFRSGDILGRIGGDEFCVLLPGVSSEEIIAPKLKGLIDHVNTLRIGNNDEEVLEVSIGAVIAGADVKVDFDDIYKHADQALYEVKRCAKNSYAFGKIEIAD